MRSHISRVAWFVRAQVSGLPALIAERARLEADAATWDRVRRQKLAAVLRHAVRYVPFYRDLGLSGPTEVNESNCYDVLQTFPVVDKEMIRANDSKLRCRCGNHTRVMTNYSGGSTGSLLTFLQDESYRKNSRAAVWYSDQLAGWRPGRPMGLVWGGTIDRRYLKSWRGKLTRWIKNVVFLDSFGIDLQAVDRFLREMEARCAEFLAGYATSLALVARIGQSIGRSPRLRLRGIVSSAEPLSRADRELIQSFFGAPVFDSYGSREVGLVAYECEKHSGLHVSELDNFVELVPIAGTDLYEVIVTNLNNLVQPFIRYRIGDLAVPGPDCSCGRPGRVLAKVVGRAVDSVVTQSGKVVHGEFFTHLFYGIPGVGRIQVLQHSPMRFTLRVERVGNIADQLLTSIQRLAVQKLEGATVTVELVDQQQLELWPTGKHRFVVRLAGSGEDSVARA